MNCKDCHAKGLYPDCALFGCEEKKKSPAELKIFSFWRDARELALCFTDEDGAEFLNGVRGFNFVNISPNANQNREPELYEKQKDAISALKRIIEEQKHARDLEAENAKLKDALKEFSHVYVNLRSILDVLKSEWEAANCWSEWDDKVYKESMAINIKVIEELGI